jgi:hypothetical protein
VGGYCLVPAAAIEDLIATVTVNTLAKTQLNV